VNNRTTIAQHYTCLNFVYALQPNSDWITLDYFIVNWSFCRQYILSIILGINTIMSYEDSHLVIPTSICRKIINCSDAPSAIGPYNQAILVDKTLYISGQLGMSRNMNLVPGGIENETRKALENIGHILRAAGGSYKDVIKTTILLRDINNFSLVNSIYSEFFKDHEPARAAFQVAALPKNGNVEIEAIALIGAVDVGSVFINNCKYWDLTDNILQM